ncbi:MAG: YrdB family protein [Thermomicrobiales bacterium]|nr:YrdB family protein [Thermomicrobiales bacterium]MCO5219488.1 YrdB family protein [Thermomicrobiales bacterium]MCO5224898.1 YrdB family protein [Thermomicrobiales bacterium]MCO5228460.1 YrdB family protein [Thermomicrobiales bacterium]
MSEEQPQRLPVGIGDIGQFVMELASLIGIGLIGWHLPGKGVFGAILAVTMIMLTGTIWGRYRTPGFVPTGREPTHPVSGPVRIALELIVYAVGIVGIWWSGREQTALGVIVIMVLTLAFSWKRYLALWNTRV